MLTKTELDDIEMRYLCGETQRDDVAVLVAEVRALRESRTKLHEEMRVLMQHARRMDAQ